MRIVHITESLGGGVLYLLHQIINAQIGDGHDVILVHSNRSDTPKFNVLDELFPPPVGRVVVPMATKITIRSDFKACLDIYRILKDFSPEVIHLHSSKAGALGRAAARLSGFEKRTYYSPHGFSFLRQDISILKKGLFFFAELVGGLIGGKIIASSASEATLASFLVMKKRIFLIENCTDVVSINCPSTRSESIKVISAGRLCYQKAPWRFWRLADRLADESASFTWVGDGEMRQKLEKIMQAKHTNITGWVDRAELWSVMMKSDIFVMTSLWEGMPLTLIDAQAIGLPAIVADVVGCRDVVLDGVTGFICKTDDEFVARTKLLIGDKTLRKKMGEASIKMCASRFPVHRMNSELSQLYENSKG